MLKVSCAAVMSVQVKVKVVLWLTVSRPICLGDKPPSGAQAQIFISQTVVGLLMWGALSDKRTGLLITTAAGPCQCSHSRVFYCLRFETPVTKRASSLHLYPPGTGWPSYTTRHWVPSSLPPTTHRATVEVFEPASMQGYECLWSWLVLI
jgi:hypothetical protein